MHNYNSSKLSPRRVLPTGEESAGAALGAVRRKGGRLALEFVERDHSLRVDIPNFEPQTAKNIDRIERRRFGVLQLGYFADGLRETIERNAGVQVMDMVAADVGGKPAHDRAGFHVAR